MKKTHAPSDAAADEVIVRGAQSETSESKAAAVDTEEGQLPGPTPEELADPTLIFRENLEVVEKELAEVSDKYLRLAAEYDNFRRRSQKEKETLYTDSVALVIKEWLPVLDSLDRATQTVASLSGDDIRSVASGIELIQKQAAEAMNRLGVSEILCLGQIFDPNLAEAVMHVEDDSHDASTVIEVFQKGYSRGDRVIRHALVKVAN